MKRRGQRAQPNNSQKPNRCVKTNILRQAYLSFAIARIGNRRREAFTKRKDKTHFSRNNKRTERTPIPKTKCYDHHSAIWEL